MKYVEKFLKSGWIECAKIIMAFFVANLVYPFVFVCVCVCANTQVVKDFTWKG